MRRRRTTRVPTDVIAVVPAISGPAAKWETLAHAHREEFRRVMAETLNPSATEQLDAAFAEVIIAANRAGVSVTIDGQKVPLDRALFALRERWLAAR